MTTHQHHPVSRDELLELVANPEIPLADIDTSQVADFPSTEQARLMHEVILALRNFDTEQLQEMVALVNHIASSAASEAADTATTDEAESATTPSMATSDAGDTTSSEAAEADATPATAALAETETATADAEAQLESPAPEQETAPAETTLEWNFDTASDLDADGTSSFQDFFGMASADPATATPAPTSGLNVFDEMLAQQEREQFLAPMQNVVSQNDSIVWDIQDDNPLVFDADSTTTLDLTSSAATDVLELENEASQASADSLGAPWGTSAPETAPTSLEDESNTTFNAEWLSLFGGGETAVAAQDASPAPANAPALNPEVAHPASTTDSSPSSAPAVSTSDGWNFDSDSAEQKTTNSNSDPFALSTNESSWDFSGVWGDIPAWDEPVNPQSIITPTESASDAQQQDTAPTVADIAALFDDGDVAASEVSSTIPGLLGSDDDGTSSFLGHQDNSPAATRDSVDAAPRSEIASSPFFATPATPTPSTSASDNGFAFNNEMFSWDGENDGGWGSQPDPLSILGGNADDAASQSALSNPPPSLGVDELFGEIDWGVDVAAPEATPETAHTPASTTTTATPTATHVADTPVTATPAPTSLFATSDADDLWGGFTLESNSAHETTAKTAPTRDADGATSDSSPITPSLNSSLATDEVSSAPVDVTAPAGATTSPTESHVGGAEVASVTETPSVATSSATTSASTATTPELNCADTSLELIPADSSFPTDPFGLNSLDNNASNSTDNSSSAYGTQSLAGSELSPSLNEEPTSSSSTTAATPAVTTTPAPEPVSSPWSLLDTLGSFGCAASAPTATTPASTAVPATTQEAADSATSTTPAPEPASNPWNLLDDVLGDYKPSTPTRREQEATSTTSASTSAQDKLGTDSAEPTGWFDSPSISGASSRDDVASDTLVANNAAAVNDSLDPSTTAAAALDPEADLAFDTVGEALAYLSTARRTEAGKYRPHSVQELRILLTDKEISLGDLDLSRLKSLHGAFANIPSERGKIPPMLVTDIEEQQAQILIQDSAYPLPLVYDLTPNWTGIESLDFSHITDLSYCFAYQFGFNNGLTTWKVDHVTSLRGMFRGCINFRSNLNHWNTARVQDMSGVFALCFHYNQPVTWNTSACTTMRAMFFSCPHFNQPVRFDTGAVTDMGQMFMNCMSFNQELNFITTQVTDMSQMLAGCRKFNSSVSLDTTLVQNFQGMFANCSSFDQEVKFSTASATNMAEMFANCSSFTGTNFRFSGTRNVKDMTRMFVGCEKFAGNLMLSTNAVEQATEMFAGCRIPDGNRFTLSQPLPEGQELGMDEQHLNFLTRN